MTVEPETPRPAAATNVYVQAAPAQPSNGLGIASLVLGILGLMTVWIPIIGLVAWIFAPLGLILGLIGMKNPYGKGVAIAGVICSGIALAACIGWVMLMGLAFSARVA